MKLNELINRLQTYSEMYAGADVKFVFDEGIGKPKHDLPMLSISTFAEQNEPMLIKITLYKEDPTK